MKAVRVQYTVKPEYVDQNKANVKAVMDDLRNNPINGMHYATYYLGDGRFMHVNVVRDGDTASLLGQRDSFNYFRNELKSSGPIEPPKSEDIDVVGSNTDLF